MILSSIKTSARYTRAVFNIAICQDVALAIDDSKKLAGFVEDR